jgi:hypothetical protein
MLHRRLQGASLQEDRGAGAICYNAYQYIGDKGSLHYVLKVHITTRQKLFRAIGIQSFDEVAR